LAACRACYWSCVVLGAAAAAAAAAAAVLLWPVLLMPLALPPPRHSIVKSKQCDECMQRRSSTQAHERHTLNDF
jgi:hypothetical protein